MKYTREQVEERAKRREYRRRMRLVHRHLALFFPTRCDMCKREYQFEFGYRVKFYYNEYPFLFDFCNECATSREDACNKFHKIEDPLHAINFIRWEIL